METQLDGLHSPPYQASPSDLLGRTGRQDQVQETVGRHFVEAGLPNLLATISPTHQRSFNFRRAFDETWLTLKELLVTLMLYGACFLHVRPARSRQVDKL